MPAPSWRSLELCRISNICQVNERRAAEAPAFIPDIYSGWQKQKKRFRVPFMALVPDPFQVFLSPEWIFFTKLSSFLNIITVE